MAITFKEYLDCKYDDTFKALVNEREEFLSDRNTAPTIYLIRSNTDTLRFLRSRKNSLINLHKEERKPIIQLSAQAPNLDAEKYATNIIVPPKSLIVAGYLEKASASKLPSIILYDVATQFKGENVKVIKNDILINKKKVCGIETFALNKGIWFECFVNVEPFNVKNFLTENESKNAKPIGFLTEELPKFDFDKMIKIIKKDFKDFVPII